MDRLRRVGKHDAGSVVFVEGHAHAQRRAKALLRERGVPAQRIVLGHQHIGDAVAGQVDEPQIGVGPVAHRQAAEGVEAGPASIDTLLVARRLRREIHQIEISVAGNIHQHLPARGERSDRRPLFHHCGIAEMAVAQVRRVEPAIALLGQNPRDAFAVEVDQPVAIAVDAARQIFKALCADLDYLVIVDVTVIERVGAVAEFERRHMAREIAAVILPDVPGLDHARKYRACRLLDIVKRG